MWPTDVIELKSKVPFTLTKQSHNLTVHKAIRIGWTPKEGISNSRRILYGLHIIRFKNNLTARKILFGFVETGQACYHIAHSTSKSPANTNVFFQGSFMRMLKHLQNSSPSHVWYICYLGKKKTSCGEKEDVRVYS